jgi:hypothetical protein
VIVRVVHKNFWIGALREQGFHPKIASIYFNEFDFLLEYIKRVVNC